MQITINYRVWPESDCQCEDDKIASDLMTGQRLP